MSLIRHPNDFARAQTMIPVTSGHAPTAPTPASHLPNGWWIVPMATLGAAMWYWIITGLFALIG
mgnify:CR=1 FL=1